MPPQAPRRGKIIIRKPTADPERSLPRRIPRPNPRFHTTTKIPKHENETPCLPTSSGLVNVSGKEGAANRISQNNFTDSSDVYNYPIVSTENSSYANSTSWPFHTSLTTEIIRHAENTSRSEPVSTAESEMRRSEDAPVSSFTSNPEITSSYDYLTEESDNTDGPLGVSKKTVDVFYSTELNPEIGTRSITLDTASTVTQNESVTSHHQNPSVLDPISKAAEGLAFPTAANYVSLQVDVPVVEVTTPRALVTEMPTELGRAPSDQADSREEIKLPDTVTTSTQSSAPRHVMNNQSAASEDVLTNVTDNSHIITSNSLPSGAYWIVGNWSEVRYFFALKKWKV